ncbi:hypothetical protein B0H13DRAFT_2312385 [Mycena leptocephala]|nr:hypothetical protein B0H13DRAFT_2312385 [Mycena leptocephala]
MAHSFRTPAPDSNLIRTNPIALYVFSLSDSFLPTPYVPVPPQRLVIAAPSPLPRPLPPPTSPPPSGPDDDDDLLQSCTPPPRQAQSHLLQCAPAAAVHLASPLFGSVCIARDLPTPINHPRKNQNENDVKNEDANAAIFCVTYPTPSTTHPARPPTPPRLPADVDDELEPQTLEPRAARGRAIPLPYLLVVSRDDDAAHETTSFAKTKTTTARLAVAAPDDDDSTGRCPSPTTRSPTHHPPHPTCV